MSATAQPSEPSVLRWIANIENKHKNGVFNSTAAITVVLSLWNLWNSADCARYVKQTRYKDTLALSIAFIVIGFLVMRERLNPAKNHAFYHVALIAMYAMILGLASWNIEAYEEQEDKEAQDKLLLGVGGILPICIATIGTMGWIAARFAGDNDAVKVQ